MSDGEVLPVNEEINEETSDATVSLETTDEAKPESTPEPAFIETPPAPPLDVKRAFLGWFGTGLAFALVGLFFGLRAIAVSTLPHILAPSEYIFYQDVTDGQPVPQLLAWNLSQIHTLLALSDLHPSLVILIGLLLFGVLWLIAVYILNPTFHLFRLTQAAVATPVFAGKQTPLPDLASNTIASNGAVAPDTVPAPEASAPTENTLSSLAITVDEPRLTKALTLLLMVGVPLAVVWFVASLLGSPPAPSNPLAIAANTNPLTDVLRFLSLGIALWIGFHREGLAGDFAQPKPKARTAALLKLVLIGLGFGLCIYLLLSLTWPLDPVLNRYQTLGTFNRATWNEVAYRYLYKNEFGWFLLGGILFLIGNPRLRLNTRALPLLFSVALAFCVMDIPIDVYLAARFGITQQALAAIDTPYSQKVPGSGVPAGPAAANLLAKQVKLPASAPASARSRSVLLFFPEEPVVVTQAGLTDDGLLPSPESEDKVRRYLESKNYRVALSGEAIKYLFNAATLDFDTKAAAEALLLDQTRCPHSDAYLLGLTGNARKAPVLSPLRGILFTCAATPENLALFDRYGDPNLFAFPDRDSKKMMGDLYFRCGQIAPALKWYERADMPKSYLRRVRYAFPIFNYGKVTGRFVWNGRPLAGARIGVLPLGMNGLPRDMEGYLFGARQELLALRSDTPFRPKATAFRWITGGTTTDAKGSFTITNLTEGNYALVCALPSNLKLNAPQDRAVHIQNAPQTLSFHYPTPTTDLGTISLTYTPDATQGVAP